MSMNLCVIARRVSAPVRDMREESRAASREQQRGHGRQRWGPNEEQSVQVEIEYAAVSSMDAVFLLHSSVKGHRRCLEPRTPVDRSG